MIIKVEQAREILNQAEQELAQLQDQVREVQALARFMRKQIEQNAAQTPMLPLPNTNRPDYAEMSLPDAIHDVLRRAGRPLHVKQITDHLVTGGKENQTHLPVSVTSAARRRHDLFVQTAKATFGLRNGVHEKRPADSPAGP
jgi:hypothetical protein